MARYWMRANLAAAQFPFASELMGRTVVVPQYDQNYDRAVLATGNDVEKDKGIPQAYYMHNCMPTAQGYQATAYSQLLAPLGGANDFDKVFALQNVDLSRFLFSPAAGKNYVYDAKVGHWASCSPFAAGTVKGTVMVTTAFVHGQSYIYYANKGCYIYDSVAKTLNLTPLTGLVAVNVSGLCAANGYMIAWDGTTVAWSSLVTETDFVPSLVTGAGGGSVNDAKGKIICCLPISGGFIVYCEKNAVAAKYSGNVRFPFIFTEIVGSGGISSPEQVSWTSNLAEHFIWGTQGLQQIDKFATKNIYPEVTDFFANLFYEDFDEATNLLSTTYVNSPLFVKLTVCSDRYVVISYGKQSPDLSYSLVYDLALKRWGKLKIPHRACFQWNSPTLYGRLTYGDLRGTSYGQLLGITYGDLLSFPPIPDIAKKTIAFLQMDGTVKVVNFDESQATANGVLILGKFQFMRAYWLHHQNTDVETVRSGNDFTFWLLASIDGKSFQPAVQCAENGRFPTSRRYSKLLAGFNISHLYKGAFNLTTVTTEFTVGGGTS